LLEVCFRQKRGRDADLQNGVSPLTASLRLVPRCSMLPGISRTLGFSSADLGKSLQRVQIERSGEEEGNIDVYDAFASSETTHHATTSIIEVKYYPAKIEELKLHTLKAAEYCD